MLAGTLTVAAGAAVIGIGAAFGSGPVVALGLALFGLGMGGGEIALDVEGAEIERGLGRSTMPAMHGCFSLGTVVGAVAGMVLTAVGFPVVAHLALVPAIRVVPAGVGARAVATPAGPGAGPAATTPRRPVWRDTRLLVIGGVILALAMAALGFLGDHYGLRHALILVLVLVAAAAFLAPAARTPARAAAERETQPA
jgi:hypothetical protein